MKEFVDYITSIAFWGSAIIIVLTLVILRVIKDYLIKKVAYTSKDEQHQNTFIGVVFNLLQYGVLILAAVIVMKLHGLDVTTIVTGLGIIATIVGLSLQDSLKDMFAGINIYNNNFYKVGDVVRYKDNICEVKYFNARVTKFRSLATNATFTVRNATIDSIEKLKDDGGVKYTFDFNSDKEKIDEVLSSCVPDIEAIHGVNNVRYAGLVSISGEGADYFISFKCARKNRGAYEVKVHNIVYSALRKAGLTLASDKALLVNLIKETRRS